MHTVSRSRATKHSVETVWEALAAFNKVEDWHPRVASSPGTPRGDFGVGASRVCHFNDGTSINERVTAFEPGKSVDIEVSEMSMPLKVMRGRFEVTPGLGGSTVEMTMSFEPKYGPIGALMATLMMKPMMTKMVDQVLEALDTYLAEHAGSKAA